MPARQRRQPQILCRLLMINQSLPAVHLHPQVCTLSPLLLLFCPHALRPVRLFRILYGDRLPKYFGSSLLHNIALHADPMRPFVQVVAHANYYIAYFPTSLACSIYTSPLHPSHFQLYTTLTQSSFLFDRTQLMILLSTFRALEICKPRGLAVLPIPWSQERRCSSQRSSLFGLG